MSTLLDYQPAEAVLGAMLSGEPVVISEAIDGCREEWFPEQSQRTLFQTMRRMHTEGHSIEPTTVVRFLPPTTLGDDSLDRSPTRLRMWLYDLREKCERPASIETYVDELRQHAATTRWVRVARQIVQVTADEPTGDAIEQRAIQIVMQALDDDTPTGRDGIDSLEGGRRYREEYGKPKAPGIPFPFDSFNRRGGVRPGEVLIVSGYTGEGKSWLGLQMLARAASRGVRTAYFSMEMTERQLRNRLIAMGGHDLDRLEEEKLPLDRFDSRLREVDAWPFTVYEGACTVDRIKAEQRRSIVSQHPYGLIIVDHLHLMDIPGRAGDYRIALNKALTQLKTLATGLDVPLVLLAQLNRPERKADVLPEPKLWMLKESSAIEQIADYIMFLYRERDENGRQTDRGLAYIEKQRQGKAPPPTKVRFCAERMRFIELDEMGGRSYDA